MSKGKIDKVTGITDGAMRTILKSALRPIWRRTSRKRFIESVRCRDDNPATGRKWYVVDCVDCGRVMGVGQKERRPLAKGGLSKKARSVWEVDHVEGISPLGDIRSTLGDYFYDLIYGQQEVVCYSCHKIRTANQVAERKLNKEKA